TCVASLLIRSPEAPDERLRIVARSDGSRQVGIEYPKLGMLAWYAMETARVEVTGEVKRQYVGFRDKQYNSVLSLPILSGDGRVIAAVSVDHANRFLFDGREPMFQTILRPYLRLLAMTFSNMEEASTPTQPG